MKPILVEQLAPSILAADFAYLGDHVQAVDQAGCGRIHVDVMDGHFVPNLSMGPLVVDALRPVTQKPLEVHLMVTEPEKFLELFAKAGSDTIIFHQEVVQDPRSLIEKIRERGLKVGMAINPGTDVSVLEPFLAHLDLALCMTVWPGFGGQAFIPESIPRLEKLSKLIADSNPTCELEVDGGIDTRSIRQCFDAGATVFVAGTAIFHKSITPAEKIKLLLEC
ncbi:MAG: ribulose-phosphate 3-epimerase [Zavarzinella sp.]